MEKSSVELIGAGEKTIASLISKFSDKIWFQIIIGFWLVAGPLLFLANPFLNNYLNKESQKQEIATRSESHKDAFESSKQAYALVKKDMTEALDRIGCDYVFLIEYHNGNENVMTGIQFCRFDLTVQATGKDVPYIASDKFRDDIVARYDILLSDELSGDRLLFYTQEEFEETDRYFAQQLNYINAKSYAIINLQDKNNKVFGSMLCVSTTDEKKEMNKSEILLCARSIEKVFNNAK